MEPASNPPADDPLPPGPRPPPSPLAASAALGHAGARAAILVEGWSDQAAVETLARRRGLDLQARGIGVVPIGGITNLGKFIDALGPQGLGLRLGGLCDAAEASYLLQTLHRTGLAGDGQDAETMEALGFFVCSADLEDELIRALGSAAVEQVLAREGELNSFRRFQEQPAQRGRDPQAQLRRFMGTRARRKVRFGRLLVEALSLECVPRPLDLVLGHKSELFEAKTCALTWDLPRRGE